MNDQGARTSADAPVAFSDAVRVWWQIGVLSFGGPAAQIALMHRTLVEERRWVSEQRFLHALNFRMLLPGPEAQQLATYVGWLLHGTRGGLVAGTLFVLPGFVVILILSAVYASFQHVPLLSAVFLGIKAALLVIVLEALLKIARRILKNEIMTTIAVLAFVAIFVFGLPFPAIVVSAALLGMIGARTAAHRFQVLNQGGEDDRDRANARATPRPSMLSSLRTLGLGLALWAAPVMIVLITLGADHVLVDEGLFFSKLATVTFGGAYAVRLFRLRRGVPLTLLASALAALALSVL